MNIPVENFRGYIASIVAGLLAVGGPVALVYVWLQPTDPARDLSVIFAALGAASGGATTFLFLQDSAARSSRATERAAEASSVQMRAAANGHQLAPLVSNFAEPLRTYEPTVGRNASAAYNAGAEYEPPTPPEPAPIGLGLVRPDGTVEDVGDRFEGDVEPDQGEKHPDEPQEPLPKALDELAEEPATPQRDS